MRSSANISSRSMMAQEVAPFRSAARPRTNLSDTLQVASPKCDLLTGGRIDPESATSSLFCSSASPLLSQCKAITESLIVMMESIFQRACLSWAVRQAEPWAAYPPIYRAAPGSSLAKLMSRHLSVCRPKPTSVISSLTDGSGGRLSHVEATPILRRSWWGLE